MNKLLVLSFSILITVSTQVMAENLESLISGATTATEAVPSQQTRLSEAVQGLLKKTTSDQNVFLGHLEKEEWKKAVLTWSKAFENTAFNKSDNGKALQALVMFKSGLTVAAIEKLFTAMNPKTINAEITHSWREVLNDKNPAWDAVQVSWNDGWTEVFGRTTEVKNKLKNINLKTSTQTLKDMSSKLAVNSKERAMVDWQLALSYALNNKADEAAKVIGQLLKNTNSPYTEDLVNLTAGRLLFQNGYFEAAAKYYEKIPKKSDYWLESQEELAWTYLRKGEVQNSVAISKSLMNSAFDGYLGPEPYFVETLGQLKICDYPKVMVGLKQFPEKFKKRTVDLDKLAKGEKSEFLATIVEKVNKEEMTWENMGKDMQYLPRTMIKDYKLIQLVNAQNIFDKESQVADSLYADSLALTGFQGSFQAQKNEINQKSNKAKAATAQRIKELAKNEVFEIKRILDKLHIVEAELVSQIDLSGQVIKNGTAIDSDVKKGKVSANNKSDAMVFPADSEVWFDEISNYKVDVKKGCQGIKR